MSPTRPHWAVDTGSQLAWSNAQSIYTQRGESRRQVFDNPVLHPRLGWCVGLMLAWREQPVWTRPQTHLFDLRGKLEDSPRLSQSTCGGADTDKPGTEGRHVGGGCTTCTPQGWTEQCAAVGWWVGKKRRLGPTQSRFESPCSTCTHAPLQREMGAASALASTHRAESVRSNDVIGEKEESVEPSVPWGCKSCAFETARGTWSGGSSRRRLPMTAASA